MILVMGLPIYLVRSWRNRGVAVRQRAKDCRGELPKLNMADMVNTPMPAELAEGHLDDFAMGAAAASRCSGRCGWRRLFPTPEPGCRTWERAG